MATKKKTPAAVVEAASRLATSSDQPYVVQIDASEDADPITYTASIYERKPFGPGRLIIKKTGFRDEAEAVKWGAYHCNMRDYRPFETDTNY